MLSTQKNTEVIVILIIIRIFLLCVIFFFKEAKMEYIYISESHEAVFSAQGVPRITAKVYKRVPRSSTIKQ
jgi:regulatory protein YycI of two-component signal transduction system YycFG